MCGIAGIWNQNNAALSLAVLKAFTDTIAHRGPDGSGYELLDSNTLGLGHRRLSILDLSEAGKQPMFNSGRDLVVSFNGEIYNFIEIRKELELKGFKFVTDTDTEVILHAYKVWGLSCLHKFNGMFAIAIWDTNSEELILIRDRFGVKPLYFLNLPGRVFAFCSETLAFKNLPEFKRSYNEKLFSLAVGRPNILEGSDKTIFNDIYQLLPGSYLRLKKGESPVVSKWWNTLDNLIEVPHSYDDQVEKFKDLFESACKLRMRSDVTLASALSGGLDSSSVYCTLHKLNFEGKAERVPENWQQAFVATFPGTTVDERAYAEKVVKHIGGKAHYLVPDYQNLVSEIVKATQLLDGIIATPITSISDVYKSMRTNGVRVSMDGHGVDEMMYGYNSYVWQAFYDSTNSKNYEKAKEYAAILCGLSPRYKKEDFERMIKQYDSNIAQRGISYVRRKLSPASRKVASETTDFSLWFNSESFDLTDYKGKSTHPQAWTNSDALMYNDFHFNSLPINLRDFDRASMQHGIEIRMPFMDYRLVSYVFSLPITSKLGKGYTKKILRDAMKNTLPEEIRLRTLKIGIGAPMEEWFKKELKEFITDTVSSRAFKESTYWNGKLIADNLAKAYHNDTLDKAFCANVWLPINAQILINGN